MLQAAILQQAAEYLYQLEQERTQLLSQNCHLKRTISQHEGELALSSPPSPSAPSKKRKLVDTSGEDPESNVFLFFVKICIYYIGESIVSKMSKKIIFQNELCPLLRHFECVYVYGSAPLSRCLIICSWRTLHRPHSRINFFFL